VEANSTTTRRFTNQDVIARDANGTLWLYPGQAS
jgi:hypothetical protein